MASARREDTRRKAVDNEHTSGLKGFWIQSFVGIALVLLLAVALLLYLWIARDAATDRRNLEEATDALAEQVTVAMARIRSQLDTCEPIRACAQRSARSATPRHSSKRRRRCCAPCRVR